MSVNRLCDQGESLKMVLGNLRWQMVAGKPVHGPKGAVQWVSVPPSAGRITRENCDFFLRAPGHEICEKAGFKIDGALREDAAPVVPPYPSGKRQSPAVLITSHRHMLIVLRLAVYSSGLLFCFAFPFSHTRET